MKERLSENGSGLDHDLTVEEVGKIRDGQLRAYLFQGREYRIPEAALEELQQKERGKGEQ